MSHKALPMESDRAGKEPEEGRSVCQRAVSITVDLEKDVDFRYTRRASLPYKSSNLYHLIGGNSVP